LLALDAFEHTIAVTDGGVKISRRCRKSTAGVASAPYLETV